MWVYQILLQQRLGLISPKPYQPSCWSDWWPWLEQLLWLGQQELECVLVEIPCPTHIASLGKKQLEELSNLVKLSQKMDNVPWQHLEDDVCLVRVRHFSGDVSCGTWGKNSHAEGGAIGRTVWFGWDTDFQQMGSLIGDRSCWGRASRQSLFLSCEWSVQKQEGEGQHQAS